MDLTDRSALRARLIAARQALPDRLERAVHLQSVLRVWLVGRRETLQAHWRGAGGRPASMLLRQLGGVPLVLPVPPNAIRNLLEEAAAAHRIALDVCMEASSSVVIKRILSDHAAFSVLPYHAVAAELESGEYDAVPLADRAMRQSVVLATSSQRPFTAAAREVAQMIPRLAEALIGAATERGVAPNATSAIWRRAMPTPQVTSNAPSPSANERRSRRSTSTSNGMVAARTATTRQPNGTPVRVAAAYAPSIAKSQCARFTTRRAAKTIAMPTVSRP